MKTELLRYVEKNGVHYSKKFYENHLKKRVYDSLNQKLFNLGLSIKDYSLEDLGDIYVNDLVINEKYNDIKNYERKNKKEIDYGDIISTFVKKVEKGSENRYSIIFITVKDESTKKSILEKLEEDEGSFFKGKIEGEYLYNTIAGFITIYEVVTKEEISELKEEIIKEIKNKGFNSYLIARGESKSSNNFKISMKNQNKIDRETKRIILKEIEKERRNYTDSKTFILK